MGIIKAITGAIGDTFADSWLEVVEPDNMGMETVFTKGVKTRSGQNVKGSDNTVSNGSIIRVYDNQFMMLIDGGKVVDYTAEPGYYKVDNSAMPSFFNGQLKDTLSETLSRIKFGGKTPTNQQVFYVNLQEIKGIKYGTRNPISYFDQTYGAELFIRAHGTYSFKITDPLKFYMEVVPRNVEHLDFATVSEQFFSEFLTALQATINQMSVDGFPIYHITSKGRELTKYMADTLDEEWKALRGMEIISVGVESFSYDDESKRLINRRSEAAMMGSDPDVIRGAMVAGLTDTMKGAANNSAGAMTGFMGVGMAMNQLNPTMDAINQMTADMQPKSKQQEAGWTCECGHKNNGKFCSNCGKPAPTTDWTCECGSKNNGNFCSNCGKARV